jgi:hypothetical protein
VGHTRTDKRISYNKPTFPKNEESRLKIETFLNVLYQRFWKYKESLSAETQRIFALWFIQLSGALILINLVNLVIKMLLKFTKSEISFPVYDFEFIPEIKCSFTSELK